MRLAIGIGIVTAAALVFSPAIAQQAGDAPKLTPQQQAEMEIYIKAGTPGAPHKMLAATAGTYDLKIKSWDAPGTPPMESTGTAVRSVDLEGRVVVERVTATMMGMPYTGQSMTGYDNVTGKYWSTWTDTMSTGIMVSEGSCDERQSCTYTGSWQDPVRKSVVTARMTMRWPSPTTEVFEMHGPGRDGKEMKMMEITYTKR